MVTAKQASKPARTKAGAANAAPPPIRTASSASGLARRLVRAAEHQAGIVGWSFSPDCMASHLKPFIEQGSQALFAANKSGDLASVVAMETATRYFVSRMVLEAERQGLPELQEITFASVRAFFCPCFPFC